MITIAELIRRDGREPGGVYPSVRRIRIHSSGGDTIECDLDDFVNASIAYWQAEPA